MKKKIAILGSTGSIGVNTLKIIKKDKKNFEINLLTTNKNINKIFKQAKEFKVKNIIISDINSYKKAKIKFKKLNVKIYKNFDHLNEIIREKNDIIMSSITGLNGLLPTLKSIKYTKKILIANKESIICGWNLIKSLASKCNSKIIPVDSEHYSIMKLVENHRMKEIKKIYLTASGGPFLKYKISKFKKIRPKDALKHPRWKMGKKITVDSSTLMNKILEIIEAQKLFNISNNKIDILIHPDSLVHAIIEFKNGLVKLLYHQTSMIIPLANAIFDDNLNIEDFFDSKKKQF